MDAVKPEDDGSDAGAEDPQREVAQVRRDAFACITVASGQARCLAECWPRPASQLLLMFSRKDVGVWCAGAAYTLQRIYSDLGYKSWVLNYGFKDQRGMLTHASTLVKVDGHVYLQDAYLKFDYPAPVEVVIERLLGGDPLEPRADSGFRDVLLDPAIDDSWTISENAVCSDPDERDGTCVCRTENTLDLFIGKYMATTGATTYDRLEALGYPADIRYLLLFPYAIFRGNSYTEDPAESPMLKRIVRHIDRSGGRSHVPKNA